MAIEEVWIGYGIEVPYMDLAKKFKIKTKKLKADKIIESITNYLSENDLCSMQLHIIKKSHSWERSESGSESSYNYDKDVPRNVYFGSFMQIGYGSWNATYLSQKNTAGENLNKEQLINLLKDNTFKKFCSKMFKKNARLMTIIAGCTCCS